MISKAVVFVRDLVVSLGRHPEDGEEVLGVRYEVTVEAPSGARMTHEVRFEEEAEAERLAGRVTAWLETHEACFLDRDHWVEAEPAYGSRAYLEAEPFLVARERAEERAEI